MRLRAAAVAAILLASTSLWGFWGAGDEVIHDLQGQFDAGRYGAVIAQLDPAGLGVVSLKLGSENLRIGHVLLGACYEKVEHPDRSLSVYQVGVRLFPRDKDLLSRLAALLHQAGLEEQAQPLFERLVRLDPSSPYGHLGLAQIDRALGFLDRSADHYRKALDSLPKRGDIWQEYGEDLYEMHDYRAAEAALRRGLDLAPGNIDNMLALALVLRAEGSTEAALAQLETPARAGRWAAVQARALWLMESGRDEEAGSAVAGLLRRAPHDPLALYVRARLGLRAGRRAQALADLRLASAQGDEAPFCARVAAKLAALGQGRP